MGVERKEGEYVCRHCHIIYTFPNAERRCSKCERKLHWVRVEKLFELTDKWKREET